MMTDARFTPLSGCPPLRGHLPPIPLPAAAVAIRQLVRKAAGMFPGFFQRLGQCEDAVYLIDPVDLSFVLQLQLQAGAPVVRAYRRQHLPAGHQARIMGTLADLLALLEGRVDSDAMFFSRRLWVEGDTAAIVTLRNALDSLNVDVVGATVQEFALPVRLLARLLLHYAARTVQ